MSLRETYQQLSMQLSQIYEPQEAANIANWVVEYVTNQKKIDRLTNDRHLTAVEQLMITEITTKLLHHMPVQYVLNEAWFAEIKFFVNENVLIPRPETEELVEWISAEIKTSKLKSLLDIGTGSGCIPVTLKKRFPHVSVRALDVSEGALNVAIKNAMLQATQVYFMRKDFLVEASWKDLGKFDIIVSNPPYIKQSESTQMHRNVMEHEPHLALFVPDEDALLFYRKVALFGKDHLEENGAVFLEINEALAQDVSALLETQGYKVELRKDMQGKDRMVKAIKA